MLDNQNCKLRTEGKPEIRIAFDGPCYIDKASVIETPGAAAGGSSWSGGRSSPAAPSGGDISECESQCPPGPNKPVCDTEGNQYPNRCLFDQMSCLSQHFKGRALDIANEGACLIPRGHDAGGAGDSSSQSEETVEAKAPVVCRPNCVSSTPDPVCDTRGKTFPHECVLSYESCLHHNMTGKSLKLAYRGPCRNGTQQQRPIQQHRMPPTVDKAGMGCSSVCTREFAPVCASNGQTYANLCLFNYASCMQINATGIGLALMHPGACAPASVPTQRTLQSSNFPAIANSSNAPQRSQFAPSNVANKTKSSQRPEPANITAAQWPRTPPSPTNTSRRSTTTPPPPLFFTKAIPQQNTSAWFAAPTTTSWPTTVDEPPATTIAAAIQDPPPTISDQAPTSAAEALAAECPTACPPTAGNFQVCATTGTTYQSICHFNRAKCQHLEATGEELVIASFGQCDKASLQKFLTAAAECSPNCMKIWQPLCDTFQRTHSNLCEFNYASCMQRKGANHGLTIAYVGECHATPEAVAEDECNFQCNQGNETICSTTGEVFPSICALNYTNCRNSKTNGSKEEQFIANFGQCHPMVHYAEVHEQQKSCNFLCSELDAYDPICADNGRTYRSLCYYNYERCLEKRANGRIVILVHKGACGDNPALTDEPHTITVQVTSDTVTAAPQPEAKISSQQQFIPSSNNVTDLPVCRGNCDRSYFPVCDNLNKTHANLCLFGYHRCTGIRVTGDDLALNHFGECDYQSHVFDLRNEVCQLECDNSDFPICDADGVTHPNFCRYKLADCLRRKATSKGIAPARIGNCNSSNGSNIFINAQTSSFSSPSKTTSANVVAASSQPITTDEPQTGAAVIDEGPEQAANQQQHLAWSPEQGWIPLTGPQPSESVPLSPPPPPAFPAIGHAPVAGNLTALPTDQNSFESLVGLCNSFCNKLYAPVCDAYGKTHPNRCIFDYNSCISVKMTGIPLHIAYDGPCQNIPTLPSSAQPIITEATPDASHLLPTLPTQSVAVEPSPILAASPNRGTVQSNTEESHSTNPLGSTGSPVGGLSGKKCSAMCTREYNPVCDSNNETYPNPCVYRYAACLREKSGSKMPEMIHYGACGTVPQKFLSPPVSSVPQAETCPPPNCQNNLQPVCDNRGRTHDNACTFNHQQCLAKQRGEVLSVVHVGECRQPENPISATAAAEGDECALDCDPNIYQPVCDENFVTYSSRCEFQRLQCEEKKVRGNTVDVLFEGKCTDCIHDCANIREPVCNNIGSTHTNLCEFEVAACVYAKKFNRTLAIAYSGECCDRRCPNVYKPICDSRGHSFVNDCEFEVERCRIERMTGQKIAKISNGECFAASNRINRAQQQEAQTVVLGQLPQIRSNEPAAYDASHVQQSQPLQQDVGSNVSTPGKGGRNRNSIEDSQQKGLATSACLKPCPRATEPVCGTDGNTYGNLCTLEIRKCQLKGNLKVLYKGTCCDRAKLCTKIYEPVCDTTGHTHPNQCYFELAQCESQIVDAEPLKLDYSGECCSSTCPPNMFPICDNTGTTHQNLCEFERQRCLAQRKLNQTLDLAHYGICQRTVCNRSCTKEYDPVCGSDDKIYTNGCHFEVAKCMKRESSETLAVKYFGECCSKKCTLDFAPVCDSNGRTHTNPCAFEIAQCEAERRNASTLAMLHTGACCQQQCPDDYSPICDIQGRTHKNSCNFRVAQCQAEQSGLDISIDYRGECCKKADCQPTAPWDPVCDTEQKSHANICDLVFESCVAQRKHNKTVALAYKGPCCKNVICPAIYEPVCDSQGVTHSSSCEFDAFKCLDERKGNRELRIDYAGECCDKVCDFEHHPVCDQNGIVYFNKCEFEVAACRKRRRTQQTLALSTCSRS